MTKEYAHFKPLHIAILTYENLFPVKIFQGPQMIASLSSVAIKCKKKA